MSKKGYKKFTFWWIILVSHSHQEIIICNKTTFIAIPAFNTLSNLLTSYNIGDYRAGSLRAFLFTESRHLFQRFVHPAL